MFYCNCVDCIKERTEMIQSAIKYWSVGGNYEEKKEDEQEEE